MSAAMPLGALLRREMVTQLRRTRSLVIVLVVLLTLLLTVAAAWPSNETLVWSQLPGVTTGLLMSISIYLLVGAGLFIPGIAGTAIVVEREQQSWDLLALTQIRPVAIVVGKVASAVAMYLVFVIALFPFIGSLYFLIGVDWAQMVVALGLVLMTSVTCSILGVACSAWSRRTARALSSAYAAMLLVMGLPTAILAGLLQLFSYMMFRTSFEYADEIIMITSPFSVLTNVGTGGWISFGAVWVQFGMHALFQFILAVLGFFVALGGVQRRKFALDVGGQSTAPPPLPRERKSLRQRLRERRWRKRKPRPPIPDGRNPVAMRERWWGTIGSARALRSTGLLLAAVSLAVTFLVATTNPANIDQAFTLTLVVHWILIMVLCSGMSGGVFTAEHEQKGMDMLRITLLTPREVVRGKFVAALRLTFFVTCMSPVVNVLLYGIALEEDAPLPLYLAGQGTIFVSAVLVTSIALAVSVVSKRTSTAVVGSFVAGVMVVFGPPFSMLIIGEFFHFNQQIMDIRFLFAFSSPAVGILYAAGEYGAWNPGSRNWGTFLAIWAVNCLEFLVVALGFYLFTQRFYARRRMWDR